MRYHRHGALDDPILLDGDDRFARMNTRLRPSQLQPGELAMSANGRMGTDQTWTPRAGYENLTGALVQGGVALYALDSGTGIIPLFADVSITGAVRASNVVTITATAHGRSVGQTVGISGTSGTDTADGNHVITTVPDADNFTYAQTGADETLSLAGALVGEVKLDESTLVQVLGSGMFSDPNDDSEEWCLVATTNKCLAYQMGAADIPASVTDIDFPGGVTLTSDCEVLQALDKVMLFRGGGNTAWYWDGIIDAIVADDGFETDKTYTIVSVGTTDFTAIGASANTVGVVFTATGAGSGTGTARSAFTLAPAGTKTQHKIFDASANTDIADGVATVTTATAHGLAVGDNVWIIEATSFEVDNNKFRVATVPDSTHFTFYLDAKDVTGTDVVYTTKASLGAGFINLPAAPWGVYHQRRIWTPYFYDSAVSPQDRNVRDELIASDLLDPFTFDPWSNQFRITGGIADYLVAVHPFNEDNLLAFNRNSIHLLKGVSGEINDIQTVEITREIGCAARRSVVTYGNTVLFLSDNGIYSLAFADEYNLRGTELPLSEAIDSLIKRINKSAFQNAVGVYHDNRYYLAIPLDDSTNNNAVLVYNFLNQGWESLDTTNASDFNIRFWHVARAGEYNELYAVTSSGGLYKMSDTNRVTDYLINNIVSNEVTEFAVPSYAVTRQYVMGTMDRKKWNRIEVQAKSGATAPTDATMVVSLEDPDNSVTLPTIATSLGGALAQSEDATIRNRIGNNRAFGLQLTFTPTTGAPSLRAVRTQGMVSYRSQTSVT